MDTSSPVSFPQTCCSVKSETEQYWACCRAVISSSVVTPALFGVGVEMDNVFASKWLIVSLGVLCQL